MRLKPAFYDSIEPYLELYSDKGKAGRIPMDKVVTRWYVAMPLVCGAVLAGLFLVIYGSLTKQIELTTLGAGSLFTELGGVTAFYFAQRVKD